MTDFWLVVVLFMTHTGTALIGLGVGIELAAYAANRAKKGTRP